MFECLKKRHAGPHLFGADPAFDLRKLVDVGLPLFLAALAPRGLVFGLGVRADEDPEKTKTHTQLRLRRRKLTTPGSP
jgi:hypothetical protein